jgi:hypothetical protein
MSTCRYALAAEQGDKYAQENAARLRQRLHGEAKDRDV